MTTPEPGALPEADPFDLPDWLGTAEVTWEPETGIRTGHRVRGRLTAERADDELPCDLLAVDEAYPVPVADDDDVAFAYTLTGTHTGTFQGHAPTGRSFSIRGLQISRFVDAKLVERWGQSDQLGILTQLGLAVALGVLLDALVVRSILVPALVLDIGPRVWWPSRLAREDRAEPAEPQRVDA